MSRIDMGPVNTIILDLWTTNVADNGKLGSRDVNCLIYTAKGLLIKCDDSFSVNTVCSTSVIRRMFILKHVFFFSSNVCPSYSRQNKRSFVQHRASINPKKG